MKLAIEFSVKFMPKFCYLLFLCLLITEKATAGLPIPSPMPLDYFLWAKNPLILTGKFTRIVYTDGKSGELVGYTNEKSGNELLFTENTKDKSINDQFMEIVDAKIFMIAPTSEEYIKSLHKCAFKRIYIPSTIDPSSKMDSDVYYKSLVGKSVILFLSHRITYQRGVEKFSTPIFLRYPGPNWNDGKPLPTEDLIFVQDSAKKAGYVTPQLKLCNPQINNAMIKINPDINRESAGSLLKNGVEFH